MNLALNTPQRAKIHTLDLPSDASVGKTEFDIDKYDSTLIPVKAYTDLWAKHKVVDKIEQIFRESAVFNPAPFLEKMDLVFLDGSHSNNYVLNDSELALRMVFSQGVIVWHDFSPLKRIVFSVLNELAGRIPIIHIKGTELAIHFHLSPLQRANQKRISSSSNI